MLVELITGHLSRHRRLVIPQLGAFVVKTPEGVAAADGEKTTGTILFSELLKRDDGVLRELLVQERGLSELEAAGAIDRFVFEVRHALEQSGSYLLEGFGRLGLSPAGTIVFRHEPKGTAIPSEPQGGDEESAAYSPPEEAREARPSAAPSPLSSRNPDRYVKGLQYGKPLKNIQGYTYVGSKPRRRVDKFLIIAIVVAVLALAAITYGYLRRSQIETEQPEQPVLIEQEPLSPAAQTEPTSLPVAPLAQP